MLRFSNTNEKSIYSSKNLPPNPPLTTILEQCFWGRNASKFYFINKYHKRCASRSSTKAIDPKYAKNHRPFTAQGRLCKFSGKDFNDDIPSFQFSGDSDEEPSDSKCSTPEFIRGVYDTYSNLNAENLLLRRPLKNCYDDVSSDEEIFDDNPIESRPDFPSLLSNGKPHQSSSKSTELRQAIDPSPSPKKTVKVDIPVCVMNDVIEQPMSGDDVTTPPRFVTNADVERNSGDSDASAQSLVQPKSFETLKSKLSEKKKTKKKKSSRSRKTDATAVPSKHVDNNGENATAQNKGRCCENTVDDVVTQMSALGLSTRRDDELTPVLQRKRISPRPASHRLPSLGQYRRNNSVKLPPPPAPVLETPKTGDRALRRRRIPIQIISDPFKSGSKLQRPHTVGAVPSHRQLHDSKWKTFGL